MLVDLFVPDFQKKVDLKGNINMMIFQFLLIVFIGIIIGSIAYASGVDGISILVTGMFVGLMLVVLILTFVDNDKSIKQVIVYNQEQEVIYDFTASEVNCDKNGIISYTDEDGLEHEIYFRDGTAVVNEIPTDLAKSKS